jgi:hypothetical protein
MSSTTNTNTPPVQIGWDPGFGNTKVSSVDVATVLQSSVALVTGDIGLAATGFARAGREVWTVEFDGRSWAVGPGAWDRGHLSTSMDYSAITSSERLALLYSALASGGHLSEPRGTNISLTVGLPVPLLRAKERAQAIMTSLSGLKGSHQFIFRREVFQFNIVRVRALAQPVGAYMDWLLMDNGKARAGGTKAEVAICDLGMNTLDLFALRGNEVIDTFVGGGEVGARKVFERMKLDGWAGHDLAEIDALVRSGRAEADPYIDDWLGNVLAVINQAWPGDSMRRFQAVIVTGGGALMLGERLLSALRARQARLHIPGNPVTANVIGLCKYGMKYA